MKNVNNQNLNQYYEGGWNKFGLNKKLFDNIYFIFIYQNGLSRY